FGGDFIREVVRRGAKVYAFAPDYDEVTSRQVSELGAIPVSYSLKRAGMNPFQELHALLSLICKLRALKIDAVFSYFIKPVIYGGIAAFLTGVRLRYSMIEGAGFIYSEEGYTHFLRKLLRHVVTCSIRLVLRFSSRVFLLNQDDYDLFVSPRLAKTGRALILPGIGVDLDYFAASSPVLRPITFVFVARLLKEKGIYDFVEAARIVRKRSPLARFLVLGGVDSNPGKVSREEMNQWVAEGLLEWPGHVHDIKAWVVNTSVFVLPSYYREGVPRSSQEAMSLGKPVITTDWTGCRETVLDGVNGFLVPIKSPQSLAAAMLKFIESPSLIARMGEASRSLAEQRYDVFRINNTMLSAL
ncbi:glycosyltransferase family 4 protein, partial [Pseudomonas aeruginosa]|uniref:glycosyltransferase family 4 protein n=1 Tax=Pseudomonas aeruginosa TaxID=287 RepID=UPI003969E3A7